LPECRHSFCWEMETGDRVAAPDANTATWQPKLIDRSPFQPPTRVAAFQCDVIGSILWDFVWNRTKKKKTTNPVRTPVSGVNDLSVSCWWDCWRKGVFNSMDAFMIHVSGTGLYKIVVGKDLVVFRSVGMVKERQVSDGFRTWRLCRNCIRTCAFSIRLEMVSMIWIAHTQQVWWFFRRVFQKKNSNFVYVISNESTQQFIIYQGLVHWFA
jgi:hypothetical protein